MLCDQIANVDYQQIVAMTPGISEGTRRWTLEGFMALRSDIQAAHKFVLEDDVAAACDAIRLGRPSSIQAAMEFAAVPFETCWIEWTGQAVSVGRYLKPGTKIPSRVGMLLRTSDPKAGTAHLFWSMPPPLRQLRASSCCVMFDFSRSYIPALRDRMFPDKVWNPPSVEELRRQLPDSKWLSQPGEAAVLQLAGNDALLLPSPAIMGTMMMMLDDAGTAALTKEATNDWEGEVGYLKAVLIMLNCKNAVDDSPYQPEPRFNRHRVKAGKLPLLEHRVIRMKLRGPERRAAAGDGLGGGGVRAHVVRGHFKIRRSGVFYWSPFVRGDAKLGTIRSRYEVQF